MMQELPAAEARGIAAAKHVPGLAS